jgi:RimJ/RimL family protein N-acetyltransferase
VGEAACWVVPTARRKGVAWRALRTMSDWMLADVGLHRIEFLHATSNEASCRVASKAGFAAEGTKREGVLHTDGWHDMHLHARLGTES